MTVPVVARGLGFKPDDAWSYATDSSRKGEFTIRPDRPGTWIVGIEYRNLMLDDTRKEYDFAWFSTTLTFGGSCLVSCAPVVLAAGTLNRSNRKQKARGQASQARLPVEAHRGTFDARPLHDLGVPS